MAFAAPFLPYVAAAGTAISGIASFQNAQYQAAVSNNNAKLLEQTAEREAFAANQDMQDQDTAARAEIAQLMAQMDASGIRADNGTMLVRRAGMESLALRDRERLAQKRDIQLENTRRQAAGQRADAKAAKRGAGLSLLSTFLNVPSSFMSSASTLNDYNRGRMSLTGNSAGGAR